MDGTLIYELEEIFVQGRPSPCNLWTAHVDSGRMQSKVDCAAIAKRLHSGLAALQLLRDIIDDVGNTCVISRRFIERARELVGERE